MLKIINDNPINLEYTLEGGMIYAFPFTINHTTLTFNLYHFAYISDYSLNATISIGDPIDPSITFRSGQKYFPILQRNIPLTLSDIIPSEPYPKPEILNVEPGLYYLNIHNLRGANNILRIVANYHHHHHH